MSIGFTNPIGGSNVAANIFAVDLKSPGGAIPGWMPQATYNTDKRYPEYEQIRFTLKNAWNTNYKSQLKADGLKQSITTPFRAINNAGDLLSRDNYSCGGSCQSFQSRPGLSGLRQRFGSISNACTSSVTYSANQVNPNVPASACNSKFVYDSSDYINFALHQCRSMMKVRP